MVGFCFVGLTFSVASCLLRRSRVIARAVCAGGVSNGLPHFQHLADTLHSLV
jgi:hypothetical protein